MRTLTLLKAYFKRLYAREDEELRFKAQLLEVRLYYFLIGKYRLTFPCNLAPCRI